MKKLVFAVIVALLVLIQFQTSNASSEMKEWTFLVFMNGHDDVLDPFTEQNLRLMEKVGSTEDINIVVQVASLARTQTERVYVEKGHTQVIQKLPRVDMGDYRELSKFIEWTVKNYPAKKYFINVWNHGSGWHDIKINRKLPGKLGEFEKYDVSFDGLTNNFITTEQMGTVMKKFENLIGHKVELYGNDACLMAMAEVAAEFSDSVEYFASSQENEPAAGWPYDKLLQRWAQNPTADGAVVGTILAEEYLKKYPDEYANPAGTTFSVVRMSAFEKFMSAVGNLRNELMGLGSSKIASIKMAGTSSHNFEGSSDYKDFYDFVLNLEQSSLGINKSTLSEVKSAFKGIIVKNVNSSNEDGAYGVSIWLPTYDLYYDKNIARYRNLEFNKKTGWADLLELFFAEKN